VSEPFTRRGYIPGIGMSAEIAGAAFSLKVGEISNVFEIPQGYLFFKLNELLPMDEDLFKKEMDTFKTRALNQKKSNNYREWLTNLRAQAKLKSNIGSPR
jgi:peptidyl-prolyl cis-trans isomerase D